MNTMHSPLLCGYLSALLEGPPESQSELGTVGGVACCQSFLSRSQTGLRSLFTSNSVTSGFLVLLGRQVENGVSVVFTLCLSFSECVVFLLLEASFHLGRSHVLKV